MLLMSNEIMAVVAAALWLLSLRGHLPVLFRRVNDTTIETRDTVFALAMIGLHILKISRFVYWDVVRSTARVLQGEGWGTLSGSLANAAFNTASAAVAVGFLIVLYLAIPEKERGHWLTGKGGWSLFSAPFYPKRFRLFK